MLSTRITYLLEQKASSTPTAADEQELQDLLTEDNRAAISGAITSLLAANTTLLAAERPEWEERIRQVVAIDQSMPVPAAVVHRVHLLKTTWFRYAAILLFIAGTATFLYNAVHQPQQEIVKKQPLEQPDIQPGGNKAILTLSDGTTIVLDSAANGALASQGNTKIIKLNSESLAYHVGTVATGETGSNTIRTPKGGQYQITLPDGTKVWLNAASSITFQTVFAKDRTVTITGEAYLEVARNKTTPFFVQADDLSIQVLGTSLNVHAYPNEPSRKVSLMGGSVKVNNTLLTPGQAYTNGKVAITNTAQDLAWKNGIFDFNDVTLQEAMRQIANWYDIEVSCPPSLASKRFGGKMGRDLTLHQVLKLLKVSDMQFRLEGRKVIISPG